MERLSDWRRARVRAGRLLVGLDFDGTLAPIVPLPGEAALLPAAEAALRRLAARPDTVLAVVSGRALGDLRRRVGLAEIFYAGNHGIELEGPGVRRVHPDAEAMQPQVAACREAVGAALEGIEGVELEDKALTLSVHYRRVDDPETAARVRALALEACAGRSGIRTTEGKRVVEIRPDVDWDKGRATRFLLDALRADGAGRVPALFIGDDVTDEDAFRALQGDGDGVVVAESPPAESAATAYLRSPDEVAELLHALAESG